MKINGENLKTLAVFPSLMTVPDCVVVGDNKLGKGHGEAKFYISGKDDMDGFYNFKDAKAKCFLLKADLIAYMNAIKNEYLEPSQPYAGKDELPALWNERMEMVSRLDEVIFFTIISQDQISGPRGYIKSEDEGYQIIRTIALPLVSYVYVEKVGKENAPLFYWKLFVDFEAIWQKQSQPLVFSYGKPKADTMPKQDKKQSEKMRDITSARDGQGKYRDQLLDQCHFCPFTMIADERLLIASHIKPWAASNDFEKTDPYNGYILSPMYDKLFDRGFITFTADRHVIRSEFISPYTWKQIGLKDNIFLKSLMIDEYRLKYLKFHHESVFKGQLTNENC